MPMLLLNIVAELVLKGTDVLYVITSRRVSDVRDDFENVVWTRHDMKVKKGLFSLMRSH